MTSNYEVLCAFQKGEWDYMVTSLVMAEADWLAQMEAEARVCAVFDLNANHFIEVRRVRRISSEERLRLVTLREAGALWSKTRRVT
jgi:hypothetical protein